MAKFAVEMPLVGVAYLEVEADSLEQAWERACDIVEPKDMEEWYPVKAVATGNVVHHPLHNRSIYELLA